MRKLVLRNYLSPGDIVMLTAAVRDLHRCYPNQFLTDVRTSCPSLWDNNPHLTPLREDAGSVEVIDCHYPLIDRSNWTPYHCIHGFIQFLNSHLRLDIRPTSFKGDIHLSELEKSWFSQVHELTGQDTPFWIVAAGGKYDFTIKWWETQRYQEVVDYFRGKIQFVQVGGSGHHHPKLDGVIDLRGQTDLRQLVRLVYHAQGVLCPVTAVMHLAAAVETKLGNPPNRPCVVIAGGREPVHWEAYPHHQFIHTIGALPCCADGGCWKTRTLPLRDGDEKDKPENLCVDLVGNLPHCMHMITAAEVIRRIGTYFGGGATKYLSRRQSKAATKAVKATIPNPFDDAPLNICSANFASEQFMKQMPAYPGTFAGRGIVICAGGLKYFTNAWICINMLRKLGCALPIQIWYLGERELDGEMERLVRPLGVKCVDAEALRLRHPVRRLNGWELKPYAIIHCPFREVLLIDADNVPVANPEFLFSTPQFKKTGAIFWPDYENMKLPASVWAIFGTAYRDEPAFESGQIVIDKVRCWQPLALCMWYNENSEFYYQLVNGDTGTYHLAFRKLNRPFSMPRKGIRRLKGAMCQHDFHGRRLFQHRNSDKWNFYRDNKKIKGFWYEVECRACLDELRKAWDGRMGYYESCFGRRHARRRRKHKTTEPPRITACMISCAERDAVRRGTLLNLARTDWGNRPVYVQMDSAAFEDRIERITHTAYLALEQSLRTEADYVLFLEDDLRFNRFILHNLHAWDRLRNRDITLSGLYNQDFTIWACDLLTNTLIVDPNCIFGGQAFLISFPTVKYLLHHWNDIVAPPDLKLPRLAGRLNQPIYYHTPSLVKHVGTQSVWGGKFCQAIDYDLSWKAPMKI